MPLLCFSLYLFLPAAVAIVMDSSDSKASSFAYLNKNCPVGATVTPTSSKNDAVLCNMRFRKLTTVKTLHNWQGMPVRASDIFFATMAPSGGAKEAGLEIIKDMLTDVKKISGHTEFDPGWTTSSTPAMMNTTKRRLIGTHVPFEWLPTEALETPDGQDPCSVVFLVREPKENVVGAGSFGAPSGGGSDGGSGGGKGSDGGTSGGNGGGRGGRMLADSPTGIMAEWVAAAGGSPGGPKEQATVNRGFAAFSNGYAAAVDGKQSSTGNGPKVLLLSQARMADSSTAGAEVQKLADFFGIGAFNDAARVQKLVTAAAANIGDISKLTVDEQKIIDDTFKSPTVDSRVVALYTASAAETTAAAANTTAAAAKTAAGVTTKKDGGAADGAVAAGNFFAGVVVLIQMLM